MILDEACQLIVDTEHKTAPRQEEGYPSIRTPNIGQGRFKLEGVYRVSQETYEKWTRRAVPAPGDLILAREAPVGNVAVIPEGLTPCLGQRTVLIRPNTKIILSRYLCYYLLSKEMQDVITSLSSGATVAHLNMKDIRSLELGEIPSISFQQKIITILSAYDDLIENNLKRIKLLEEAAQHLYREWFVNFRFPGSEKVSFDKETGLPNGWEKVKMEEIMGIYGGGTPSTKNNAYWDGGDILWFSPTDLSKNHSLVLTDSAKKITQEGLANSSAKLVPPLTILMSSRATIGLFGMIKQTSCTNQGFINIIPKAEEFRFFILFNLMSRKGELEANASGATFKELSKRTFKAMDIIRPERHICEAFHIHISRYIDKIENLEVQNQKLKVARDLLLPRLMNKTIEV